jgi:hypothetical protein
VDGAALPIHGADQPSRWRPQVSSGAQFRISKADRGGLVFSAQMGAAGGWVYPVLALEKGETPATNCVALVATINSVEGQANFRAIFDEANHSAYFSDFYPQPKPGETVEAIALLKGASFGEGWSAPDENHQLDPDRISTIRIGCNPQGDRVIYSVRNIRWITPSNSEIPKPKAHD